VPTARLEGIEGTPAARSSSLRMLTKDVRNILIFKFVRESTLSITMKGYIYSNIGALQVQFLLECNMGNVQPRQSLVHSAWQPGADKHGTFGLANRRS
jgi:hypothetical protein